MDINAEAHRVEHLFLSLVLHPLLQWTTPETSILDLAREVQIRQQPRYIPEALLRASQKLLWDVTGPDLGYM